MRLKGKTALVTGATSGIGTAIAVAFAQEGAQVVITGRNAQQGQAVVERIHAAAGSAQCIVADLSSRQGIDHLIHETSRAVQQVDILVNNAAIFPMAETPLVEEAVFDEVIATNLKAPFFLTAAFAPRMAERGMGKVINITTTLAHRGFPKAALYGATKAALTLMTKSWAVEFGPQGVNVNAIAPHLVITPGTAPASEFLEHLATTIPARRTGLPAETAAAAVYLASNEADFIHGITLPVDGGYLAS
ncbi:MAG: glucose 1-dehydrogenase [Anaerolineaceae bacterium]|nr:glucose 1-dehydrogenase [Anaerolineaceae bacterium]